MSVLVVDDSRTMRRHVREVLEREGHQVIEATDGIDGLATLRERPDIELVLCDVNMPRLDGVQMVEALHREAIRVPVLMLTTEGQPGLMRRARAAGVKGWVVKPFEPAVLVNAVRRVAPQARAGGLEQKSHK